MAHEEVTFFGPSGTLTRSALVDTGARNSIVSATDAHALGVRPLTTQPVRTDASHGNLEQWGITEIHLAVGNLGPVRVPLWVAPDGIETTLGETSMAALGYMLVRPLPGGSEDMVAAAAQPDPAPLPTVPASYAGRLAVCRSCPNLLPGLIDTCAICGCPIRTRVLGTCPIGRF